MGCTLSRAIDCVTSEPIIDWKRESFSEEAVGIQSAEVPQFA
jgi:hypothetical protein